MLFIFNLTSLEGSPIPQQGSLPTPPYTSYTSIDTVGDRAVDQNLLSSPSLFDYAILEMRGVVAWRDLSLIKRTIRLLKERAPPSRRLRAASQTLERTSSRELSLTQMRSQGIDLKRGIVWMFNHLDQSRILIATKKNEHMNALIEGETLLGSWFRLKWATHLPNNDPSKKKLFAPAKSNHTHRGGGEAETHDFKTLNCTPTAHWIICDEGGVQSSSAPSSAPSSPPWFHNDLDQGALWAYLKSPKWLPSLFQDSWFDLELHLDLQGDEFSINIDLSEPFNPLYGILSVGQGRSEGMSFIHPTSPGFFKLSLNISDLQLYPLFLDQTPWLKSLSHWAESGWDGDLILTFDGGFDHPVLIIGLKPHPWAWERLAQKSAKHFKLNWDKEESNEGYSEWTSSKDKRSWSLPIGRVDNQMIVALFPADVKRRLTGLFPHENIGGFSVYETKGVSGFFFDPTIFYLTNTQINLNLLVSIIRHIVGGKIEEIVDIPQTLGDQNLSLASSLTRLSQLNFNLWTEELLLHETQPEILIAFADFLSLFLILTDGVHITFNSYFKKRSHIGIDLRWRIL